MQVAVVHFWPAAAVPEADVYDENVVWLRDAFQQHLQDAWA
jgi:hypothetical protein